MSELKELIEVMSNIERKIKALQNFCQILDTKHRLNSDRLDALEQQAAVSQSPADDLQDIPGGTLYTNDTERSCENCANEKTGCRIPTGMKCGDWQPRAEQTERSCDECDSYHVCKIVSENCSAVFSNDFANRCEDFSRREQPLAEQDAEFYRNEMVTFKEALANADKQNAALRAELAEQKRIAQENGELALKRGLEIKRLEKEQSDILFLIQTRLQPPGSPCPGGPVMLVTWITGDAVKKIKRLEEQAAELTVQRDEFHRMLEEKIVEVEQLTRKLNEVKQ